MKLIHKQVYFFLRFITPFFLMACGGGSSTHPTSVCNLSTNIVSFNSHVLPIFNDNCLECHQPGTLIDQKPYLTVENAFDNLVSNPIQAPGVTPFVKLEDPENSQLYRKIIGDERAGSRMPLGRQPLKDDEICIVKEWISQGAKNN